MGSQQPLEVRQKIRELAHRGADHIKILSTGAVLTHGSNAKSLEFTPEELHAAVDEASNFGLRVEAHAHAAEGIRTPSAPESLPSSTPRSSTMKASRWPRNTAPISIWISTMRNVFRTLARRTRRPLIFSSTTATWERFNAATYEGRSRGRQDVVRHGRRRLPPWHQRPPIRVYG